MKFIKFEDITTHLLKASLAEQYQIVVKEIFKLGGYSNRSFKIVGSNDKEYIARLSHPLKKKEQLNNESFLLNQLQDLGYKFCPKIIPTLQAESYTYINYKQSEYPLQVFEFIPGIIKYRWEERCSKADLQNIFTCLPELHRSMAHISCQDTKTDNHPINIAELLESAIKNQPIGTYLAEKQSIFTENANELLQFQEEIKSKSKHIQWIHGDVHLENLLFLEDKKVAFIDFEKVQIAPLELDIIFSAFRIAKISKEDKKLLYNKEDIRVALESYASQNSAFRYLADQLDSKESLWKALFCLDQALLYLAQAYKGVWELEKGIGFLACFNEVLAYEK